jgi:DNA-binding beta-propeller fold protein YncE
MRTIKSIGWQLLLPVIGAAACVGSASDGSSVTSSASSAGGLGSGAAAIAAARAKASYTEFESGQVRPLALSPSGNLLFATNTPDGSLEVFRVSRGGLQHAATIRVGLEPVAVAARSDNEVWVVNHLSDSVSVVLVDPASGNGFVARTLLVGDEPRDVVFAGPNRSRAFVTTAHRGQNTGRDPQLTTPGVGRADVWVFDANNLGTTLAGTPLNVITLFTDTPRALAVSADGKTVYAAGFQTGNRTTVINERIVTNNGFTPPPNTNAPHPELGMPAEQGPPTGLVVKYRPDPTDNGNLHWLDNVGRRWDANVKLSLPDKDVFAIDATANPPAPKGDGVWAGVGTVLFGMAVNPVNGKIYVSNTDARNDVRFEGHNAFGASIPGPNGTHPFGGSVRGHIVDSRITVLDGANVAPRFLNKHIDYTQDGTPDEVAKSLAFPTGMAVTSDGSTLYVAAFGSSKLGVYATSDLENDTFVPSTANEITLTGGGPTGVVVDEKHGVGYVLTHFDDGISVVDLQRKTETAHVALFDPEPASIVQGRRFLYDASYTSGHGDQACASCHVFGDFDSLAWDLGDPDNYVTPVPGPFTIDPATLQQIVSLGAPPLVHHPEKGPMTTQSLRGMANHGAMHWRGDRTGGTDASRLVVLPSAQPDTGTFDEQAAFKKFNVAFQGLVGRSAQLTDAEMQTFTDFILQVMYPPNPIRNLDNSLTPDQQAGKAIFFQAFTGADGQQHELPIDSFHNCNGCHTLDPQGNAQYGVSKPGFFGSSGEYSFEDEAQYFKVPHLRNLYQKVGMFGMDNTFGLPIDGQVPLLQVLPAPYNDNSFQGDQVRGVGFAHDGSTDTIFRFLGNNVFQYRDSSTPIGQIFPNPGGFPTDPATNIAMRRKVESFLFAFDTNHAPIVGQQVTVSMLAKQDSWDRLTLLEQRAGAGECDLVGHGALGTGWLYFPTLNAFATNRTGDALVPEAIVRAVGKGPFPITFTCAPVGSGVRLALDRDLDGDLDGDSRD